MKQKWTTIHIYVSSFGDENNLERVRSKRLQNMLLSGYQDVVDEIRVADLNQEIVKAHLLEAADGGRKIFDQQFDFWNF